MKKSNKQTVRTVVQAGIGIAVALPGLVSATGVDQTLPWVAGGLAVSAAVTRLMLVPQVQKFLGWLNTDDEEKQES